MSPKPRPRRPPPALAFQDDRALLDPAQQAALLDQIKASGAKDIRTNVIWGNVRKNGAYDFSAQDALVNAARARGLRVQMTLLGTPAYMTTGDQALSARHADPALAGQYAQAVAQHFAGRVGRYSAWNEPNAPTFLADRSAKRYRLIYQAMRKGVKSVSPQAQMLLGELAAGNSDRPGDPAQAANFMRRVFAAGNKPLRAEGFALHPYAYEQEQPGVTSKGPRQYLGINQLKQAQAILASAKARGQFQTTQGGQVPLYLTEFGVHQSRGDEAHRAAQVANAYALGQAAGAKQFLSYQMAPTPRPADPHKWVWDTSVRPAYVSKALRKRR